MTPSPLPPEPRAVVTDAEVEALIGTLHKAALTARTGGQLYQDGADMLVALAQKWQAAREREARVRAALDILQAEAERENVYGRRLLKEYRDGAEEAQWQYEGSRAREWALRSAVAAVRQALDGPGASAGEETRP